MSNYFTQKQYCTLPRFPAAGYFFPLHGKLGNHITHFNHFVLRTWEPPARVPNEKQSTGLFFSPPALLQAWEISHSAQCHKRLCLLTPWAFEKAQAKLFPGTPVPTSFPNFPWRTYFFDMCNVNYCDDTVFFQLSFFTKAIPSDELSAKVKPYFL